MSDHDDIDEPGTLDETLLDGPTAQDRAVRIIEELELGQSPISMRERIQLRTLHSSGGIGEVWLAYDELLHREVALKRLKSEQIRDEDNRARFFREARITGQLDHPGIVPVYDYSSADGGARCYYTMRFVRGKTLREVTKAFHARREEAGASVVGTDFLKLLGYFVSVCNTISFAHSKRIIHRDLKGDNIIIGDYGEVVVLDWGLAKPLDEEEDHAEVGRAGRGQPTETQHGERLGTPAYMAPEQALGLISSLDERTDVYGLAAILYEVLTGRPPFLGEDLDSVLKAVVSKAPVPPRGRVADVPERLEAICLRSLAKAPDDRHPTAADLGHEVSDWISRLAERKRTEQERERFFRMSIDLLAILDGEDRIEQSNPAWEAVLGLDEMARADAGFVELIEEAERAEAAAALAAVRSGDPTGSFVGRMRTTDGRIRWVNWNLRALSGTDQVYLVGRDVTAIKASERRFRGLLESAPDACCVVAPDGRIAFVNRALEQMFGFEREELTGQPVEILVPDALRGRHTAHVEQYLAAPRARPIGSGRALLGQRKDGKTIPIEISLGPVETDEGLVMVCTIRELDARRREERMTLAVLDAAPDAMLAVDREHIIRLANRRVEEMFGYPRSQLVGRHVSVLIPEALRERHREHERTYLANPEVRAMGQAMALRARHRDGSELAVQISLSPVDTEEGMLSCCAIRPAS